MKILITGAQGQVGKELVSIANQRGFDVIAAGQTESGKYQDWINQQYEK